MSFDSIDDNCKECGMSFFECEAVKEYDDEDDPCPSCLGSGTEFEGDIPVGDCRYCGGIG